MKRQGQGENGESAYAVKAAEDKVDNPAIPAHIDQDPRLQHPGLAAGLHAGQGAKVQTLTSRPRKTKRLQIMSL
jgi:hypothetical protein